jgi:hypothetical protein
MEHGSVTDPRVIVATEFFERGSTARNASRPS